MEELTNQVGSFVLDLFLVEDIHTIHLSAHHNEEVLFSSQAISLDVHTPSGLVWSLALFIWQIHTHFELTPLAAWTRFGLVYGPSAGMFDGSSLQLFVLLSFRASRAEVEEGFQVLPLLGSARNCRSRTGRVQVKTFVSSVSTLGRCFTF